MFNYLERLPIGERPANSRKAKDAKDYYESHPPTDDYPNNHAFEYNYTAVAQRVITLIAIWNLFIAGLIITGKLCTAVTCRFFFVPPDTVNFSFVTVQSPCALSFTWLPTKYESTIFPGRFFVNLRQPDTVSSSTNGPSMIESARAASYEALNYAAVLKLESRAGCVCCENEARALPAPVIPRCAA